MRREYLRMHHFLPRSAANGPGRRAAIWVQGCSRRCPGCFNKAAQPFEGGELVSVDDLFERIVALGDSIEGISLSGGEPLEQLAPLLALLRRVRRETGLSALLFTGWTWDQLQQLPEAAELLACLDIVIAGPYDASRRLARDLRGSANQTLHFLTDRYSPADLAPIPEAEIIICPSGEIIMSGVDPPTRDLSDGDEREDPDGREAS